MTNEELVKQWQKKKDRKALDTLRTNLRPLVQGQVNKYRSNSVSNALLLAEADSLLVDAATNYNPRNNASFSTYLYISLKKLNRFSAARSNIGTIPEARTQKITQYMQARDNLTGSLGRVPTQSDMKEHLGWSTGQIRNMKASLRNDVSASAISVPPTFDTQSYKDKRLMDDMWYELTGDEKKVFAAITGKDGRRPTKVGREIAARTGFSTAKVSMLRTSIGRKMEMLM